MPVMHDAVDILRPSSGQPDDCFDINPFGFQAKTAYEAQKDIVLTRSATFRSRNPPKDPDIWKRPPPDFCWKNYNPLPPKRNTREAMKPWRYGSKTDTPGHGDMALNVIASTSDSNLDDEIDPVLQKRFGAELLSANSSKSAVIEKKFISQLPRYDTFAAKLEFARNGMYRPETYKMPRHHDFRQYPPIKKFGLPEFQMQTDPDPYNIKFNTSRLNIIHGLSSKPPTERDVAGSQMAPPLPRQPEWESKLILKLGRFPTRPGSYTRFRRSNRDVYSAYMERVDTKLTSHWAKEKRDEQLQEKTTASARPMNGT